MKKLQLTKANPGNYSKDKPVLELVKSFNNGLVEISDERIYIKTNDNKTFTSSLKKTEEDFISETFQGTYEDGTSFRLIKPSGVAKQIMSLQGQGESISFGGMTGDGYAVHFNIVEINAPDGQHHPYPEQRFPQPAKQQRHNKKCCDKGVALAVDRNKSIANGIGQAHRFSSDFPLQ